MMGSPSALDEGEGMGEGLGEVRNKSQDRSGIVVFCVMLEGVRLRCKEPNYLGLWI